MYSVANGVGFSTSRGLKLSKPSADPRPCITAAATGTLIAMELDLPFNRRRVRFCAEGKSLRWLMDGKVFSKRASAQRLPWPGRHVVQIAGERGRCWMR